jgi:RpiB/LacA/LacB family sugar-phosphate isomerase
VRVGLAADHGGFPLKEKVRVRLEDEGFDVVDLGTFSFDPADDYPDYVIPLARAVSAGQVERGIAICGSGVGAGIVANRVRGVRAGVVHEVFSAHQGVEDDDMNILCLGGRVVGFELGWDLIMTFLHARFSGAERHKRRLAKATALEEGKEC